MLNLCVLTGNLGADPEIKYDHHGDPIAQMNLAFQSAKDKTGWIKLVCFKKLAEACETYLHQGERIGVTGTLTQDSWETPSKEKRTSLKLIVQSIEFIKTDGRGFEKGKRNDGELPF